MPNFLSLPEIFCPQTAYILPVGQEVTIQPYCGNATGWRLDGLLPSGFVFDSSSGRLHGNGIVSGVWNTKTTAINSIGESSLDLLLGVYDFSKERDIKKNVNINIATWDVAMPDAGNVNSVQIAGMVRYGDWVTFNISFYKQTSQASGVSLMQLYPELYYASFSVKGLDTEPTFFILQGSDFRQVLVDGKLGYELRVLFSGSSLLSFLSDVETDDGASRNCLCEFEFYFRRTGEESFFDSVTTKPFLMNVTRDLFDK